VKEGDGGGDMPLEVNEPVVSDEVELGRGGVGDVKNEAYDDEVMVGLVGVKEEVGVIRSELVCRMSGMEEKMETMGDRMSGMGDRMSGMEEKMKTMGYQIGDRMSGMGDRMSGMEGEVKTLSDRMGGMEAQLTTILEVCGSNEVVKSLADEFRFFKPGKSALKVSEYGCCGDDDDGCSWLSCCVDGMWSRMSV